MTDLTPILQALCGIIAVVLSTIVIPYIKKKLNVEQIYEIERWINIAVTAAQQIYTGIGKGEEKKAYVLNFLAEKGFVVDTNSVSSDINAMIEASVYELKN